MVDTSKIRINDLARELEVKSKAILDVLTAVGVTEKKTHSSSITVEEAEKVRAHVKGGSAPSGTARPASRPHDEIKTKIDLSHITRPGDVLRALQQKQQAATALPKPQPKPIAVPASSAKPVVKPAAPPAPKPPAPAPAAPEVPAPRVIKPPTEAPPRPVYKVPEPPRAPEPPVEAEAPEIRASAAEEVVEAEAPAVAPPPVVEELEPALPVEAPISLTPPTTQKPAASKQAHTAPERRPGAPKPGQPIAPQRRMVMPQTGPRPVYQAPPPRPQAGAPASRPAPGRPIPGQPIFQRTRPGAPAGRPPLRPGERRPMHPTRSSPSGMPPRPGMGVPGLAPPGAPGSRPTARPGAPSRRPGQRYIPRGVKEGPMKGFVPPPRLTASNEPLPITRNIVITEGISVKDLAEKLGIRAKELITRLLARGVLATVNQTLDAELAKGMARHFGAETEVISFEEQTARDMVESATQDEAKFEALSAEVARPPVVTIMGHVDHGKTTLLDSIRHANVAEGEAGGITQHIGAYKVKIADTNSPAYGREIVFIDTPGHEAFTRMRARGAKVTDIVVLVVAADDGVMPQTIEAIDHAKAANVPLIVAVNKIDKPDALPDRVKKQLGDRGLMPEAWGGETVFVDVSAKQKTNLNLLLEMICLTADLQNLRANPERQATGTVLEAKLDRGRGNVATVLVQNGTLHNGDYFVVGNTFGRVRAMFDERGEAMEEAPPSTPTEILGLDGLPEAGDQLVVVADREKARNISDYREQKAREAALAKSSRVSLEGLAEQLQTAGQKELNIILKADVQGSVEVLSDLLGKQSTEKVKVKVLRTGVGAITESDVLLATASNAIIIGFNVRPERKAAEIAEQEKVQIRMHSIIYELQDEIRKAVTGLLEPIIKETYLGRAEVRDTFRIPKVGTIAGCYVQDGVVKRDAEVRLLRDNVQVYKGKVASLRRFKEDVSEVRNGMECGIAIQNYGDVKVGDVIEAYHTERIAAELSA
jgi:translation initiation factor IF-2